MSPTSQALSKNPDSCYRALNWEPESPEMFRASWHTELMDTIVESRSRKAVLRVGIWFWYWLLLNVVGDSDAVVNSVK